MRTGEMIVDVVQAYIAAHGGIFWTLAAALAAALLTVAKGALAAIGKSLWKKVTGTKATPVTASVAAWPNEPLPVVIVQPPVTVTANGNRISSITCGEIVAALEAAKPLQKDSVRKSYEGNYVQWDCSLHSASQEDTGYLRVMVVVPTAHNHSVHFEVKGSDYREFYSMDQGRQIRVTGRIQEVTSLWIDLEDVSLEFPAA